MKSSGRGFKKILYWLDDRTGISAALGPILRHPIPPKTGWWYVFGSATLIAFIIEVVTGTILALSYIPSTSQAYQTLQFITSQQTLGRVLRGMHFFGASAMVLLVGIHMLRVFIFGAYKYPREASWLSGVVLLFLTVTMGFTGQLLRWDQNAVWSVVVGAEQAGRVPWVGKSLAHFILGGEVLGGATLSRFFATHVFFIPGLIFGFLLLHLFLVIRNGISERPSHGLKPDPKTYRQEYEKLLIKEGEPFWPDAAWRDMIFGALVVFVVLALAAWLGPPALDKPPDPTNIQAQPRPDWYLLWYFAVLALLPHGTESYVIVLAPLAGIVGLILLPFLFGGGDRIPIRRPWAIGGALSVVVMVGAFSIFGVNATWAPNFDVEPLPPQIVGVSSGPIFRGAQLFYAKACIDCHQVAGQGGLRGPDLSLVGERLTENEMIIRILNGGRNMPAYGNILNPGEVNDLVSFLRSRKRGAR